ncbi:hypothetical protein [Streptomyces sp. NPDC048172]|uniref:hypothetical protein n=1 Tax=Streptomyces sp. NPDC048172 TaxID=3365505 RepID=UPI003723D53B
MTDVRERPGAGGAGSAGTTGARRAFAFFRGAATLLALAVLAQVGLAAGYLGGDYDSLERHGANAGIVVALALLTSVTTVLVRRTGGPLWPVPLSLVLVLALFGEMMLGMARVVAVHVALGTVLVSAVAVLVTWAWLGRETVS